MIVRIFYRGNSLLARRERRGARRSAAAHALAVRVPESGDTHWGVCRDVSASGISFALEYVPRFDQLLEIRLAPVQSGPALPLRALVRVRRCTPRTTGKGYEIGAAVEEVLQPAAAQMEKAS